MAFSLKIKTGNEAFADDPAIELARILRRVADRIEVGETDGKCMDVNGNAVGAFVLTGRN